MNTLPRMSLSVIISTYNSPEWLEKVVWGYQTQSFTDFELLVADDGSDAATTECVKRLADESAFPIRHLWQEHKGFGKCAILNKAIAASEGDYLLISDGDCVPKADFLAVHMERRKPGCFLSGGYCKLPMSTSMAITKEDIVTQRAFDPAWLRATGCDKVPLKLRATGKYARFLNTVTPTVRSWNGHNSSGWKSDIVAVNGFNEDMNYGGLDRELGERLLNLGLKPIQIRHLAICIHLDHSRGYKTRETIERNHAIRSETRRSKRTWIRNGILKGEKPRP